MTRPSMPKPWTSCFLTGMLLRYLEAEDLRAISQIDCGSIMREAGGFQDISNPEAFLKDPNNWVPHAVIRELIRSCERNSGDKGFAYKAALAYYQPNSERTTTLFETIVTTLNDVELVISYAGLWASGLTNYLHLKAFSYPDEPQTMHLVSQFCPPVIPLIGNTLLVKGNLEGFATLLPDVNNISCKEEYSQIQLDALITEFSPAYHITEKADCVIVARHNKKKPILIAKHIKLVPEQIESRHLFSQPPTSLKDEESILPEDFPENCVLRPHYSSAEAHSSPISSTRQESAHVALRVEQGGTLESGLLKWHIPEGTIYNAPYTRYRIEWQFHTTPRQPPINRDAVQSREKGVLARLLFDHLHSLKATQRRTLSMVVRQIQLVQENTKFKEELSSQHAPGGMLGQSKALKEVLSFIQTVAPFDATVLITGETGCGKELAARLIHQLSSRQGHRFLAVNCGAVPENLIESTLFGHVKGAFTGAVSQAKGMFEQAEGGTLFLDEIGEVSLAMQTKLLRVLQEREFNRVGDTVTTLKANVRLVAATNRNLKERIKEGHFREDLFYRLNGDHPLHVPPLRERKEDIPSLISHFLHQFSKRTGKSIDGCTKEALALCRSYDWPGNIRQLQSVIEHAAMFVPDHVKLISLNQLCSLNLQTEAELSVDPKDLVDHMEWAVLLQTLRKAGSFKGLSKRITWAITCRAIWENRGNKSAAAKTLGRSVRWIHKLLDEGEPPFDSSS